MSYIRALSNPEAMYAYGGEGGRAYISANTCVDKDGKHIELSMPSHVFTGLFRKWVREVYPEEVTFKGAKLVEIPSKILDINILRKRVSPPNAYQWRLTYPKWGFRNIVAFKVTWFYVAQNVIKR
jgi:hypothetical protein